MDKSEQELHNAPELTTVFLVRLNHWMAMWHGHKAPAVFNSRGAAQAWINTCNAKGMFHS